MPRTEALPNPEDGSPSGFVIRPARLEDSEAIRAIYNHEVATGTATFDLVARSVDEQRRWLTERSGAHAVIVGVVDGEVAGFASLSRYKERPAYNTTVEDSIYLAAAHQGKGLGEQLLNEIIATAALHGFHAVVARISGESEASIRVHAKVGFEIVGREREVGRKFGRWLDVVVMQKLL
jgi:L-amino acid N-acyltransferase